MSKGSEFWGNASGKLGQQVLYRAGGEQRARMYVSKIKNPKTLAQMKNRLSMLNLTTIFKSLKPIISVSFPNRKSIQSGFNAFVQANKNVNTPVVPKSAAQMGLSVPYNMVVSQGSLALFGEGAVIGSAPNEFYALPSPLLAKTYSDPNFVFEEGVFTITTQEDFETLLGALGLPTSAKMTVIVANYADEGYTCSSITVDSSTIQNVHSETGRYITLFNGDTVHVNEGQIFLSLGDEADDEMMFAVIFSYTDGNGKLQVNTARMTPLSKDLAYIEQFLPGGDAYQEVLDSYGYNEGSILSTK